MDIGIEHFIILFFVGLFVGFVNVVSGGGSMISIPVMIFLGLPAPIANASSRVGIFVQNLIAVKTFQSKGYTHSNFSKWLSLFTLLGSGIGSYLAVIVPPKTFELVLAIMIVVMILLIYFDPKKIYSDDVERLDKKRRWISILLFFILGIYGGFIQAGTAVLMIIVLRWINNMNLVTINHMKVFIVLGMNLLSLLIFEWNGIINWHYGLAMACGSGIGGYYGTIFSIKKGEIWIKRIVTFTLLGMFVKLLFNYFQ